MGNESAIEWTDATWNPWHKARYGQDPNTVVRSKTKFYDPLKWKEPRKIFTCSWSDFFIEEADEWRDEAFAIMALTPQHTYQVLTKRPERMLEYLAPGRQNKVVNAACKLLRKTDGEAGYMKWLSEYDGEWPPKNVWLGVSVEDQKTAAERIPLLLQTPAAPRAKENKRMALKKNEYWAVVDRDGVVMTTFGFRHRRCDAISFYTRRGLWNKARRELGVSVKKIRIEVIEETK